MATGKKNISNPGKWLLQKQMLNGFDMVVKQYAFELQPFPELS